MKTEKYQFAPKSRHEGLVANRRLDFQEEGEINEKLGINFFAQLKLSPIQENEPNLHPGASLSITSAFLGLI